MIGRFVITRTHDGTVIANDPRTGLSMSGKSVVQAIDGLRRLIDQRDVAA